MDDYSDVIQGMFDDSRANARTTAVGSINDSPDDAARSLELSKATGVDPSIIHGDVENFEQQHKAGLASKIVGDNQYISDYVNSHPLAAKLSNDDYGQLDTVSMHLQKMGMPKAFTVPNSIVDSMVQGFKEGFGSEGLGQYEKSQADTEFQANHPYIYRKLRNAALVVGVPLEVFNRTFSGALGAFGSGAEETYKQFGGSEQGAERFGRDIKGMAESHLMTGHAPEVADNLINGVHEATLAAKPYIEAGIEPPIGVHEVIDKAHKEQAKLDNKNLDDLFKEAQASKTRERDPDIFAGFIRQHTDAKIGISVEEVRKLYGDKDPTPDDGKLGYVPDLADQLRTAEATGGDVEIPLADWVAKTDPGVAKELHDFVRVRPGGMTLEESKDLPKYNKEEEYVDVYHGTNEDFEQFDLNKARNKYEKAVFFAGKPEGAENYVETDRPGRVLAARLPKNRGMVADEDMFNYFGRSGDVTTNLMNYARGRYKDYVEMNLPGAGKIYMVHNPEVIKDLRVYKEIQAVDIIRQASALKPLEDRQREQELKLRKAYEGESSSKGRAHGFEITNESGGRVGEAEIIESSDGKDLHVNWVGGAGHIVNTKGEGDNVFGPKLIRQILEQLKKEFPNAETISGNRVSGAREKTGTTGTVSIPLRDYTPEHLQDLTTMLGEGEWQGVGHGYHGFFPTGEFRRNEAKIVEAADKVLNRIVPKLVESFGVRKIAGPEGQRPSGLYTQYANRLPIILYAMDAPDPIGTARHEAIHHLRRYGFFTEGEWGTLTKTAEDEGWIEKYKIDKRYKGQPKDLQLEEAIADAYKHWDGKDLHVPEGEIKDTFLRLKKMLLDIRDAIVKVLGNDKATWQDLFYQVEKGEIGSREGTGPMNPEAFKPAQSVPEEAEKKAFEKAGAIGMTVTQYNRYQRLIEQRNQEDQAFQLEQAKKQEKREQTKEWKENEAKVRDEVAPEMANRPDIAADNFFRDATLHGAKLGNVYKIGSDFLSEEQKEGLPKAYYSKLGIDPDSVAGLFGYQSGKMMVDKLVELQAMRKETGLGPKEFFNKQVDQEVARQMSVKYGNLDENILNEAKEHVISETQMDMLHEEVLALGTKAGGSFEISKQDLKNWVKGEFDKTQISQLKTDKFLASAGRAGRLAEDALLKGDYSEAFRTKQQQYLAMLMARESKKLEKAIDQFDRTAKRMSKREVPSMAAEYTNWVHDILMRVGQPVRRSVQDLQEAIAKEPQQNLKDFVKDKQSDLREVPVADFLYDSNYRKRFDDLTAEEFEGVHGSIKTLIKNGRDENKIYREGAAEDLEKVLGEMKDRLKEMPVIQGQREVGRVKKAIKTYIASSVTTETLLNKWDENNPRGLFNQYIMRPLVEAANYKSKLERKYAAEFRGLGEVENPKKEIENHLFYDPSTISEDNPKGDLYKFNRLNMLAVLQNVGNPGNLAKLVGGHGVKASEVMRWLFQNTTKEDWDRAQSLGDLFARIKRESDGMYYRLSGVSPENIELHEIQTPFGTYPGWYHPLIADPLMLAEKGKVRGDALEGNEYFRATTAAGYTKARTGALYPLDFSFDQIPNRINQMLHDLAFREPIIQASKVFYDKSFINEVTRRQGEVYSKGLKPYLRDVANGANFNSFAQSLGAKTSEFFRQNVIGTYVGMNIGTVMKHGPTALVNSVAEVGVKDFSSAMSNLLTKDATTGESNWAFAMKTSEELQRRSRNWRDTTVGAYKEAISDPTLREKIMELGTVPVALSDLLSAVPTWLAQYNKSILDVDHGQAIYEADRAVRRAHGSTAITNLPAIARNGPLHAWITSLYGFFGNQMQRRFEIAWDMNKTAKLVGDGEFIKASKNVPRIAATIFAYVIMPSIIEDQVESQISEDKQGFIRRGAGILAKGISSSFIGARDLVHGFASGHEPSVGLLSAMFHDIENVQKDIAKGGVSMDKQHAGNTIMHTLTFFGDMTGLVNQSEGRALKYVIDYATGQQKPKSGSDVVRGLHHGSQKITSPIENEVLPNKVRR